LFELRESDKFTAGDLVETEAMKKTAPTMPPTNGQIPPL